MEELVRVKNKILNNKGSSMLLVICVFLVMTVLGINLLNAVNANVSNTKYEYDKEQAMLYVSSIYDIVNSMIENGSFSDDMGTLPSEAETIDSKGFKSGAGENIEVHIEFSKASLPIISYITISYIDSSGNNQSYTIKSTYSKSGIKGKYIRESCKGLVDDVK